MADERNRVPVRVERAGSARSTRRRSGSLHVRHSPAGTGISGARSARRGPSVVTSAEGGHVAVDRRDTTRRAEVVRTVLEEIVHNSVPFITIETITKSLHVSTEAATRIIERLVSAGLLVEAREGIWIRVSP